MASRRPRPIQAVSSPAGFRIGRPGARYVAPRSGEEHRWAWLPADEPLRGAAETFTEGEARLLLPLLWVALGKGGRPAAEPTTPDWKLVASALKRLGLTAEELG